MQVSLTHLGPWFAGGGTLPARAGCDSSSSSGESEGEGWGGGGGEGGGAGRRRRVVRRNPSALLRGSEHVHLWALARRWPLTHHDMSLTADEHQARFGCIGEVSRALHLASSS